MSLHRSSLTTLTLQSDAAIKELQRKKEKVNLELENVLFDTPCCVCPHWAVCVYPHWAVGVCLTGLWVCTLTGLWVCASLGCVCVPLLGCGCVPHWAVCVYPYWAVGVCLTGLCVCTLTGLCVCLTQGEKILRSAEMCRKLETEEEKVSSVSPRCIFDHVSWYCRTTGCGSVSTLVVLSLLSLSGAAVLCHLPVSRGGGAGGQLADGASL